MCGILAVIGKATEQEVEARSKRQSHRGPDERDVMICEVGALSHERLAIIDLHTGKQPIQGTRNTWVVHNGEIYNYREIHDEILGGRYHRRTTSDSESIVHLYEEFGSGLCDLLDGMWAFVVLDDDKGTFIAGRDPIGVKPLYWGHDEQGRLWFSSEMKAIVDICPDMAAFPPGHYYTPEDGLVEYYQPKWLKELPVDRDFAKLRPALEKAVEKRLVCDVPFGVLLSGGLDSSLIASITARKVKEQGGELHSFSIGLDATAPDLVAAKKVADFIGTIHHEVNFSLEQGLSVIKKLIWHLESYDVTTIRASTPMYFLSEYIRKQGIKMVLSGEGADEVFGGYLYFFLAPNDEDFHKETIRRVNLLHTADLLRADKSTMAHGLEARVPLLDKEFLEVAMSLEPSIKRPLRESISGDARIEKYVLRKAFDDKDEPFLPDEILWRQKEQFSDGVGYSWIDGLKEFCEQEIPDEEMATAESLYPYNTPATKEAFFIRRIFHELFPEEAAAKSVKKWIPMWQDNPDPSGRANLVHEASVEVAI